MNAITMRRTDLVLMSREDLSFVFDVAVVESKFSHLAGGSRREFSTCPFSLPSFHLARAKQSPTTSSLLVTAGHKKVREKGRKSPHHDEVCGGVSFLGCASALRRPFLFLCSSWVLAPSRRFSPLPLIPPPSSKDRLPRKKESCSIHNRLLSRILSSFFTQSVYLPLHHSSCGCGNVKERDVLHRRLISS